MRREPGGFVEIEVLVEFLCAAHVAQQVESPWEDRGGIALVAEPGQMKTTILGALAQYPNVRVLSDVNMIELANMRSDMTGGRYRTLAFQDFQKLYERNQDSAANVEGTLRSIMAEGWQGMPHESQMVTMPARAFVVLCMTPSMFRRRGMAWKESGFLRRFLWIQYALSNPEVKAAAMDRWEKLPMGDVRIPWPVAKLPVRMDANESVFIRSMVEEQPGDATHDIQFQILVRTYQVLKWHYRSRRGGAKQEPIRIMAGVKNLLGKFGGELVLSSGPQLVQRKKRA